MAHVYVRSGAVGTGTGASWANAYTTLAAALSAKAAGDNFWVSEDHAETAAGNKIHTSPGTITSPCTVICVNHSGSVPPVSADLRTTATITTTGAFNILINGYAYYYGIAFSAGTGAVSTQIAFANDGANAAISMKSCSLAVPRTNGLTNAIALGTTSAVTANLSLSLDNVPISFGSTADCIDVILGAFLWTNTTSALPGSAPDGLFYNAAGTIICRGVDLSAMGSGKNLTYATFDGDTTFDRCKLGASVAVPPGAGYTAFLGSNIYVLNSDSGATNYRNEKWSYCGSQVAETTIVRTGGATDGTTPISTKIVTTADAKWIAPYESMPLVIWNDTTAANVTVTVYGVWGGGAVPNNDDIWIEVGYEGSSATPVATINTANGKADYLATGTGQTSDSSTWGGSTTKFKMAVTLSSPQPGLKGPIYVTVKAAKASSTFYIDPKVVLT